MQDMRIQLEALHPTELTEQKSAWFTLPIYEDELSETLGIEEDSEDFTVADIDLPYDFIKAGDETITLDEINEVYYMFENLPSDIQDEIEAIMEEYDCLEDLHNQRHDIYCLIWQFKHATASNDPCSIFFQTFPVGGIVKMFL